MLRIIMIMSGEGDKKKREGMTTATAASRGRGSREGVGGVGRRGTEYDNNNYRTLGEKGNVWYFVFTDQFFFHRQRVFRGSFPDILFVKRPIFLVIFFFFIFKLFFPLLNPCPSIIS